MTAFLAAAFSTVFVASRAPFAAQVFDASQIPSFVAIALGAAWAAGGSPDRDALSRKRALAAVGLSVVILAGRFLPVGGVIPFLGLLGGLGLAFGVVGATLRSGGWSAGAGIVIAAVSSPLVLDAGGSPDRVAAISALGLAGLAGLGVARRGRASVAGAVAVAAVALTLAIADPEGRPRFVADGEGRLKPVLAEVAPGGKANVRATAAGMAGRSDLVEFPGQGLGWIFTNGTAPVVLPDDPGASEARFPLAALPFDLVHPARALFIGSVPGPELEIARARGTDASLVAYDELGLALRPNAGRALPYVREGAATDLVLMTAQHTSRSVWVASNPEEQLLFTRESLGNLWDRVAKDGALAIVLNQEVLFLRAALTLGEALEERGLDFTSHVTGIGLGPGTVSGAGRFLLLATRPDGLRSRALDAALRERGLVTLFGGGREAMPSFRAFDHPGGLDGAREFLRRGRSPRWGVWLDLEAPTDRRPFFFQIARDFHPFGKAVVSAALAIVLFVLLLPLARFRTVAAHVPGRPPIPVMLGDFVTLGVVGGGLVAMVLHRLPVRFGEAPFTDPILLGAAALVVAAAPGLRRLETIAPAVAGIGLLTMSFADPGGPLAGPGSRVLVGLGAIVLGAGVIAPLEVGRERCVAALPGADRWVRLAFAASLAGGAGATLWIAQLYGWPVADRLLAAALAAHLGARAWSRRGFDGQASRM